MQVEDRTVRYSLTRKDIFAFQIRALRRHRFLLLLVAGIYVLVLWTDSRPIPGRHDSLAVRLVVAALDGAALLAIVGIFALLFLVLVVWTAKHKNVLGEHVLSISDEGLVSKSATGEGLVRWGGIDKVISTPKYLLIYLNESSAKMIPKRFFTSAAEASVFEQEVRGRMQAG